MNEKPKAPKFTLGFIIFAAVVMVIMSILLAMLHLPTGLGLVIAVLIGWNIRKFYFGPWQTLQASILISLNNWLIRGKD